MNDFTSGFVSGFSDFLSQNKSNLKRLSKSTLISYSAPVDFEFEEINLNEVRKNFERSFYLEKSFEEIRFLSLDQILKIEESGSGRFAATERKIKSIKENFFCNWETELKAVFPLFLGAMKFTVEHPDEDWKDFNDSTWFVPELLFIENNNKSFLLFNFFLGIPDNSLTEKLNNKLKNFINTCCKKSDYNISTARQINGNDPKDKKKWKNLISEAINEIEISDLDKVVLSRRLEIFLSSEPDFVEVIKKLRTNYKHCYNFLYTHKSSCFFGTTPERLAKFCDNKVELDALAGSAPRGSSEIEDAKIEKDFLKSEKNIKEHQFVIDYLKNSISSHTENIEEKNRLSIKKLRNIQHLHTIISASLKNQNSIFKLLDDVFPTPAICGVPKENALSIIKKLEQHNRGLYSGILGWFNFFNNGEFIISIRSAVTSKNKVIAFAGGGIVDNSKPDDEFKETELKFKPILSLFSNEN